MKINSLTKHIYYNNWFLKNEVTKIFADNYFINKDHKYDIYHFYIFCTDKIKHEIKNYFNDKSQCSSYYYTKLHNLDNSSLNEMILDNDELNICNKNVKQISDLFTMLHIGNFLYDGKVSDMFLKIDDCQVNGFSIDMGNDDYFFKNYQRSNLFSITSDLTMNDEINKSICYYSSFKMFEI